MVMKAFSAPSSSRRSDSNLGTLLALSGAEVLQPPLALPGEVTIVGIILRTATVNLVVGWPPPSGPSLAHPGAPC